MYGFLWSSNYARWFIDGKVVRTIDASEISSWPNEDMYIVLNNGQRTASPDDDTNWPNYLVVDYIALYQKED